MARLVVEKENIIHNYRLLCEQAGVAVIPVLKANGYGLGAEGLFSVLKEEGCALMAVSRLEEALPLCERGVEILLLSCGSGAAYIQTVLEKNLTVAVGDVAFARALSDAALAEGKKARVHIKVDTGMGRFGFLPEQIEEIATLFALEGLEICGIFSHLHSAFLADGTAKAQFDQFEAVTAKLAQKGLELPMRHIANSTAAVKGSYGLDAVRIGSALIGRLPISTTLPLKPVGRFEAEVLAVRKLKKGDNLGYGGVCRLKKDTTVAIVAAGSADGFYQSERRDLMRFSDRCRYLFHDLKLMLKKPTVWGVLDGKRVPMLGRPATTHSFFDVTDMEDCLGKTMTLRISRMPLVTAEKSTKADFVLAAMIRASVVLPTPGGPQKIMEEI